MVKKEQIISKSLLIGVGVAAYAQEKAEKFVKELTKKGELNKTEGKKFVKAVYQEADKSRKRITKVVESELKKMLKTIAKAAKKTKKT
jgi:polyhydroxyalkanoate synthesis regulator phasin